MEKFALYGSGGHAKVVLESLCSENKIVIGVFDDNPSENNLKNVKQLGVYQSDEYENSILLITIGNNKIRKNISEKVRHDFGITIHSSALISASSTIGKGSMILHRAIVQTDAKIGNHVIVNTSAVVEHDCTIGDYVHIAPGAVVCGNVQIGDGTLVGANAVIAPNIKVGKWCQISAGSSVLQEIPDFSIVKGVPGIIFPIND